MRFKPIFVVAVSESIGRRFSELFSEAPDPRLVLYIYISAGRDLFRPHYFSFKDVDAYITQKTLVSSLAM